MCPECNVELSFSQFYKNKNTQDKLSYKCKSCVLNCMTKIHKESTTYPIHKLDLNNTSDYQVGKPAGYILTQFTKLGSKRYQARILINGKYQTRSFLISNFASDKVAYEHSYKWLFKII